MEKPHIKSFIKYMENNPELAQQFRETANPENFAAKIMEFGHEHGYPFTEDQLAEQLREYQQERERKNDELSDKDLDAMSGAGGFCITVPEWTWCPFATG